MIPKIAFFVINHASVGGVERVTSNLISIFTANNYDIHSLISLGNKQQINPIITYEKGLVIKSIEKENLTSLLITYLKKEKITHLIFQGDNMSISKNILKAVNQTNCKAYLHYHGSPFAYLKKHLYWSDIKRKPTTIFKIAFSKIVYPFKKHKLLQNIIRATDGFITVSNGVTNELNSLFTIPLKNIQTIHNPFSFSVEKEICLKNKEKTIIFVSRLERKHKNAFIAIKAWELLHKKYPDWQFTILGNGSLFDLMTQYVFDNNIKNISLLGDVTNVNSYLEKSTISILTSDCEGFGMGLFESIAYKNALVSTNSDGGVKDLIQHDYNGFIVPKNDHIALANKIECLILDKKLRTKMQENSFTKYRDLISKDTFSQWRKLLKLNDINS